MVEKDSREVIERRTSRRFQIQQEIAFKILGSKTQPIQSGTGRTMNISSGGILFETGQHLRYGSRIEASIHWPVQLEGGCPLKFVVLGRVVRCDDKRAAVRIEHYEFRTRRIAQMPVLSEPDRALQKQQMNGRCV